MHLQTYVFTNLCIQVKARNLQPYSFTNLHMY
jgi:hypothetical protein